MEVEKTWTVVREAAQKAREGVTRGEQQGRCRKGGRQWVAVTGDLNAETKEWLKKRGAGAVTRADEQLEQLRKVGLRPQAREATWRAGTQIDNWLVCPEMEEALGKGYTTEGVCGEDHTGVGIEYITREHGEEEGEERAQAIPMEKETEQRQKYIQTMEGEGEESLRETMGERSSERLRKYQDKVMEVARREWVAAKQKTKQAKATETKDRRDEEVNRSEEGSGGKGEKGGRHGGRKKHRGGRRTKRYGKKEGNPTQKEKMENTIAKWKRLKGDAERWNGGVRKEAHKKKTLQIKEIVTDEEYRNAGTNGERRAAAIQVCIRERRASEKRLAQMRADAGDRLVEELENAITDNAGNRAQAIKSAIARAAGVQTGGVVEVE